MANLMTRIAVLNTAGLVLSVAGFAWLMAAQAVHWGTAVLLGGGLLLSAAGALWLVVLVVRREMTGAGAEAVTETTATPPIAGITNGPQLVNSLLNFQDRALDLIERRRTIHHLNTRQSHYVHPRETDEEIEANKRYRESRNDLDYQRLNSPTQFWDSIDSFKEAVEERVSGEVYSAPSDQEVHLSIARHQQRMMEEINQIAAGFRE